MRLFWPIHVWMKNCKLNSKISRGSAAANLTWSRIIYPSIFSSLSHNTKVKELLKSTYICQSYYKNKSCTFYGPRCKCVLTDWTPEIKWNEDDEDVSVTANPLQQNHHHNDHRNLRFSNPSRHIGLILSVEMTEQNGSCMFLPTGWY